MTGFRRPKRPLLIATITITAIGTLLALSPVLADAAYGQGFAQPAPSGTVIGIPTGSASASAPASATPSPSKTPATPRPHPHKHPRPHPHKHPRPHPKRKPWPVSVVIRTVPALAGITFSVDGVNYTTNAQGTVTVTMEHNRAPHTLVLKTATTSAGDRRYAFYRWTGQRAPNEAYLTTVTGLPWRADSTITASFATECLVNPSFTDQYGARLDPSALTSATLQSQTGQMVKLPVNGPSWLSCTAPVLTPTGLDSRPISYRLETLVTKGTNIANSGQQVFNPAADRRPTFTGYYYNLSVTAQDAMFGGGAGTSAVLTEPDGTKITTPFAASGAAVFDHLPRGSYTVAASGGGVGLAKTLRVSRDTAATLDVLSGTDLGVGAAGGGLFILIPFLPATLRRLRRRGQPDPRN